MLLSSKIKSLEKNPVKNGNPINETDPINKQKKVIGLDTKDEPLFLESWSSINEWIIDPALKNKRALKKAWLKRWNKLREKLERPAIHIIYPNWLHVEKAITFLKSFWNKPIEAAKNEVNDPRKNINIKTSGNLSIKNETLIVKNTPAVTIVAAWIRADTGVGPSIASGSQLWRPNWEDLPVAAKIKNIPM